ncbi:hypothetical protein BDV29DRAFT_180506 [Aspergillus leporis]|uniref:Mating alpha-pheromone PpgA n=1 Tax=Aspergillus leporis TaxID=41062 RepID=A0A5N5WQ65_9EURO|nr:hypothetical protein BDV29DRAFT_180506 [Aspergillus leporis]
MKLISIALAATTVQAAALQKWCHLPGQPYAKIQRAADASGDVRRSADALAEAMPDAEALQKWCHLPGRSCAKVKRAAKAIDEARRSADGLAEAMAALNDK